MPRPIVAVCSLGARAVVSSFDILHLFAQFLDLSLDRQRRVLDRNIRRFRKHGVRFAIEFLKQEIQALADFTFSVERRAKLFQ